MNLHALRTIVICLLLTLLAGGAFAADPSARPGKAAAGSRVTLDFKEIELTDLIQTISELTGQNFLYDDTVRGKVTLITPDEMTLDEAYQLFQTVLNIKGFTIVPSGKVNKIVPLKNAKESNLPIVRDGQKPTEQYVTRLVRLVNLDASTIAETVLSAFASPTSNILVYSPTNTLIITDSAVNIERMVHLISELDLPGSAQSLEVIQLKYAGAEDMARLCNELLGAGGVKGGRRSRGANAVVQEESAAGKIVPLTRTNSLVVLASAEQLAAIHELIAKVDQDLGGGRANINVYRLENASAEPLAKTINEILTGIRSEARSANPAAAAAGPVTVTADKPTNSLIINAKPDDYLTIRGIIEKLDVKRKQVYVEALIMELSMDATQQLGVSLQGAAQVGDEGLVYGTSNLNRGPVGFTDLTPGGDSGIPSLLAKAVDGLMLGGFFNPITVTGPGGTEITVPSLSVLINLSKTDGDVNILSAPRLLTSDNEEAEIIVGNNVPIITSRLTDATGGDSLAQSVSVERKDVALTLRFTPQVTEGDLVRLNVYQEMTDIVPYSAGLALSVGNPSDVGPSFTKRVLRNTVLAENGKTVVLGGLIGTNISESVTKVPWLGDIPFLGWLFKTTSTSEKKTNLLIFINPTIIRGPEDLARVTRRNRQVAERLTNEKTLPAVPDNYFKADATSPPASMEAVIPAVPPAPLPAPAPDHAPVAPVPEPQLVAPQ